MDTYCRGLFIALTVVTPMGGSAALVDRGGGLIYDTELNITWLKDGNLAQTSGYDADGLMTWQEAVAWSEGLVYYDSVREVVYADWRLPSAREADGGRLCFGYGCTGSEMGHLYYTDGIRRDGNAFSSGPFVNFKGSSYWSSTPAEGNAIAWLFTFGIGKQDYTGPGGGGLRSYAWAVRDGDVADLSSSSIRFSNVTRVSGINHTGPTFGASWGDFNGDRLPDLFVGNHYDPPSLYLNSGSGTFIDIADSAFPRALRDDHGAAWADVDKDGDLDLIELVGGGQSNHLWMNIGGGFWDVADQMQVVASPRARSRTPLWFDWDGDSYLDLALTQAQSGEAQPYVLRNMGAHFVDASERVGVQLNGITSAYLSDLTGDGRLDLAVQAAASPRFPAAIYSTSGTPFTVHPELTSTVGSVSDAVFADFNGDLRSDIFITRGAIAQQLVIRSPERVEFRMVANGNEKAVTFKADARVQLSVFPGVVAMQVYAGGGSQTPPIEERPELAAGAFIVTLDSDNPVFSGMPSHTPGTDSGLYIGFDPVAATWTVALSSAVARDVRFVAQSAGYIQDAQAVGFSASPTPPHPSYLLRTASGFQDSRAAAGLRIGMPCFSAVGGDFDNDMDVDLYLACAYGVSNAENVLLENRGDGTFQLVPQAGGAAGTNSGRSESVVTADYDLDGFLDLFVTNGEGGEPFNNGPHQLFRNLGNANRWIEIDLVGRFSNPHGIGAMVKVRAGGKIQMREQNGGIHTHAQNLQRLHLGLGSASIIDQIEIAWPSGVKQLLRDVTPNQLLTVSETGTSACSDGLDNDGDGLIDFPSDSTCSSWSENRE